MVQHRMYAKGIEHIALGDVAFLSNTIKYGLLKSTYTPNLSTDEFYSVIDADEVAATGNYTAGGVTLASKTVGTVDDAAVTAWATGTAYAKGDIVRPSSADGHIYLCTGAGTSHASTEPTWDTGFGQETGDNGIVWTNMGDSYVKFDAANAQWTSSTITARYGVVYVSGTAGVSDYVLALVDAGGDEVSSGGTFEILFHSTGIMRMFRAA